MTTLPPPGQAGLVRSLVRPGAYFDSITLMQLQRRLREMPGVEEAGAVMATEANKQLLAMAGLLDQVGVAAGPGDLVVAVRGADPDRLEAALGQVDILLRQRPGAWGTAGRPAEAAGLVPPGPAGRDTGRGEREPAGPPPRTLRQAVALLPGANLALISVPGRFARWVAEEALDLGLHVFCFSDNVPLDDEVALKAQAARRGLLFMGPDCGTALVAGTGLGFANAVRPGPAGIVAASGTGLQEVACQLDRLGVGVRHAIGTGGRDLHEAVGGATFRAAVAALARDPGTRLIVALSKPPSPAVKQQVLEVLATCGKPVVVHFLGEPDQPCPTLAATARAAAAVAADDARTRDAAPQAAGGPAGSTGSPGAGRQAEIEAGELLARARRLASRLHPDQRRVWGLYGGGTLCYEGQGLVEHLAGPVASNAPLPGRAAYRPGEPVPPTHLLLDLGADEFTTGRLHPMLDAETRLRYLAMAARDPAVAVVLLDVVLGYGAHPDPAGELAPAIVDARATAAASGRHLVVVVALCGTGADPQGLAEQARRLEAAGAMILPSHAEAALLAGCVAALAAGRTIDAAGLHRWLAPRGDAVLPAAAGPDQTPPTGTAAGTGTARGDALSGNLLQGVVAVNIGVPLFAESLAQQQVPVVHVDWRPPAGGNPRLLEALRRLRS